MHKRESISSTSESFPKLLVAACIVKCKDRIQNACCCDRTRRVPPCCADVDQPISSPSGRYGGRDLGSDGLVLCGSCALLKRFCPSSHDRTGPHTRPCCEVVCHAHGPLLQACDGRESRIRNHTLVCLRQSSTRRLSTQQDLGAHVW